MQKRIRKSLSLLTAVLTYYLLHGGAHLIYALIIGSFRQINIGALGVQIDVHTQQMTEL